MKSWNYFNDDFFIESIFLDASTKCLTSKLKDHCPLKQQIKVWIGSYDFNIWHDFLKLLGR